MLSGKNYQFVLNRLSDSGSYSSPSSSSCGLSTALFLVGDPSRKLTSKNTDNELEMEDGAHQKYIISRSAQPFYNQERWHGHSLQTSIELSVCGGNIIRLLAGEQHPHYQVGVHENGHEFYRVSHKINLLHEGADIFNTNKPIDGLIFLLVISYFLGDVDISNIGVVDDGEKLLAVRFDPEFCFSSYFTDYTFNSLNDELVALFDSEILMKDFDFQSERCEVFFGAFFSQCFKTDLAESEPFFSTIFFNDILRKNEIISAVDKILTTPLSSFVEIIANTVSDKSIQNDLMIELELRLNAFKQAHKNLLSRVTTTDFGLFKFKYMEIAMNKNAIDFNQKHGSHFLKY